MTGPAPRRPQPGSLSQRIYRGLLGVYPTVFRAEYGDEMAQVFTDCCRDARRSGASAFLRLWASTLTDLAVTAAEQRLAPLQTGATEMFVKRTFDVVFSLFFLILLSPFLLVVAALIRLESPGPALYRSSRVGKGGRTFTLYKFRSMPVDAARLPPDKRFTRAGRWLRPYGLDELPQFVNVLLGDMSLIGPRPPLPGDVEAGDPVWQTLLGIRPGITGPGQVAAEGGVSAERAQALSVEYAGSRSLRTDLAVLRGTWRVLVGRKPQA